MLTIQDFNPKPLEPNREDFRGLPEVCKQEIASTHPEVVVVASPFMRISKIATANGRDWILCLSIARCERLDEV